MPRKKISNKRGFSLRGIKPKKGVRRELYSAKKHFKNPRMIFSALMQTLKEFERTETFTWDHPEPPFGIDEQLAFILPSHSYPGTPAFPDELYKEGPDSRPMWMKAYTWETDPYISLPWDPARPPTRIVSVSLTP